MNNKVKTQGTAVKEEQHQELLKVLAKFEQKTRTVAHKEDVTVDEVLELLRDAGYNIPYNSSWNVWRNIGRQWYAPKSYISIGKSCA